jgi:hypothetical protein
MWVIMEYVSLKTFYTILKIFLKGHIVQLIILFDKRTEIHLNDRKYQICPKNLETSTFQPIHLILHDKNVLGYIG